MRPRHVALLVSAALTTGWLLASVVSPPVADLQTLPERVERRAPAFDPRAEPPFTEQLQLRLQSAPPPPTSRRNPFVFAEAPRPPRAPARAADASRPADPSGDVRPAAEGPALRLSGIGSTNSDNGVLRTAVLADGTTVHLVKVGEAVAGYTVAEITDDAVVVQNSAGERWMLRMR